MSAKPSRGPLTAKRLEMSAEFMKRQRAALAAARVVRAQRRLAQFVHQPAPTHEKEELAALRAFFVEVGPMFLANQEGEK